MKIRVKLDHEIDVNIEDIKRCLHIEDGMSYRAIKSIIENYVEGVEEFGVKTDDIAELLTDLVCETLRYYIL